MVLTGKISGLAEDWSSGKMTLSLAINEKQDLLVGYDELSGKERISIEIKPYKEKRSNEANAYMWTLLTKLARVLKTTKDELYLHYVKEYGICEIVPILTEKIEAECVRWSKLGLGWMAEPIRDSKLEGYTNVLRIYGTSTYDRAEFSELLEQIVEDCKAQGIQTEPQERIDAMVEAYFGKEHTAKA